MEDLIGELLAHLRGIWTYRWIAAAVSWPVALGGWGFVYAMPDHYQSSARVYVDTQSILKPLMAGMTSVPNVEQQVSLMSRTLLSRPNLERLMRMVDLDVRATDARQHELLLESMRGAIRISGTRAHDIYTISYTGDEPTLARDVVQALLTLFVEGSFEGKQSDSRQAVQFIDQQVKSYERRLLAAESALKLFKQRNSVLLSGQEGDYNTRLVQAGEALAAARLDLLEAQQARQAIRDEIEGGPSTLPLRIHHPEIDARIATVSKNLDALRLQYTELHPDVLAARRLLAQLELNKLEQAGRRDSDPGHHYSPMLQQLKVALAEANAKVAAADARQAEWRTRHARLLALGQTAPEIETQLARLNRDYALNKDNYEKLIGRREAAHLSGELAASTETMSFRIIDPPSMPQVPSGPARPMLYSAVLLAALMSGAGIALLISQARPTFPGPAAMRELTGLQVLGTVSMHSSAPALRRQRRGLWLLALCLGLLTLAYTALLASAMVPR